jgi:putative pyoverdin transport system ATP-binding/permease protein
VLLLKTLQGRTTLRPVPTAMMMMLAGGSNALILSTINSAAQRSGENGPDLRLLTMFCLSLGVYVIAQRQVMSLAMSEIERILNALRMHMLDKLRHSDLEDVERLVPSRILTTIAGEPATISNQAPILVAAAQAGFLLLFVAGYVAYLSLAALALTAAAAAIAISIFLRRSERLRQRLREAAERDQAIYEDLDDLLNGFKEVKMSTARGIGVARAFQETSDEVLALKQETARSSAGAFVFAQSTFYVLLAVVVFVVPAFAKVASTDLVKITSAILFLIGPISMIIQAIPALATANSSMERLMSFDALLPGDREPLAEAIEPTSAAPPMLRLEGATFAYAQSGVREGFRLGPLDFIARPGEIVFITGGNGSGKTTLMKLMAGLYQPDGGKVVLGDTELSPATAPWLRDQVSIIFSDFHLFRRLYGLDADDPVHITRLLRGMQLDRDTAVERDRFSTIRLSTGQRRRLALVVTLLEDRPVLIFDEWAADQDPTFRRKFYEEILPSLKVRGKVVICATHDEQYFEIADRRYKLEFGLIVA